MSDFERNLFEKIKNKDDLSYSELQYLERVLYMTSFWNHLLSIQINIEKNDLDLQYVSKGGGSTL